MLSCRLFTTLRAGCLDILQVLRLFKERKQNKNCTKLKNKMACVCVCRLNTRTTSPAGLQGLA